MAKQDSFVSKVIGTMPLGTAGQQIVSFDNGETHKTSSSFVASVDVPEMRGYVRVWLTKAGRIADMKPITTADVERHVRALAEADPEHVYRKDGDRCTNVDTDTSEACIVGRAFMAAGIPETELRERLIATARGVIGGLGIPGEVEWLTAVQDEQDDLKPWGAAVAWADHRREKAAA